MLPAGLESLPIGNSRSVSEGAGCAGDKVGRGRCARGRVVRYPQRAVVVLVSLTRQPCMAHGRRAINCLQLPAGYQRSTIALGCAIPLFPIDCPCLDQIACCNTDCGQQRRCNLQYVNRCADEYGGSRTHWPLMFRLPLPQQVCRRALSPT